MRSSRFESFLQRVFSTTDMTTQTELATVLQINRSAITQARRKDTVPARWILQLFRTFGLNPLWLESGKGEPYLKPPQIEEEEFKHIPKVKARLSAGGGSFEIGSEIEGYYAFRNEWLRVKGSPERMVLMDIFGNSMEPELKDGDAVLIDESQKDIIAGAIFAVGVEDTILVKRIEKHPSKLVLRSDNKDYAPIFLEGPECESVRIIGKVIWAGREFT
ncbi:MAG: transcriptional regulator [Deltaproteobacteria bacterium SG8_13]|nr:MAG: transcriptional regulator [Deltaproteobacteria bacterium SG8_13]